MKTAHHRDSKYCIYNNNDERYYTKSDTATFLHTSPSTITKLTKEGLFTFAKIENRLQMTDKYKVARLKAKASTPITNDDGKQLTIVEAGKIIDRHISTIRLWVTRDGCTTIRALRERDKGSVKGKPFGGYSCKNRIVHNKLAGFDTNNCHKEHGQILCKYYSECSESRVFDQVHHARYKKDFSCFTEHTRKIIGVERVMLCGM